MAQSLENKLAKHKTAVQKESRVNNTENEYSSSNRFQAIISTDKLHQEHGRDRS
jgi:hypothetical protein